MMFGLLLIMLILVTRCHCASKTVFALGGSVGFENKLNGTIGGHLKGTQDGLSINGTGHAVIGAAWKPKIFGDGYVQLGNKGFGVDSSLGADIDNRWTPGLQGEIGENSRGELLLGIQPYSDLYNKLNITPHIQVQTKSDSMQIPNVHDPASVGVYNTYAEDTSGQNGFMGHISNFFRPFKTKNQGTRTFTAPFFYNPIRRPVLYNVAKSKEIRMPYKDMVENVENDDEMQYIPYIRGHEMNTEEDGRRIPRTYYGNTEMEIDEEKTQRANMYVAPRPFRRNKLYALPNNPFFYNFGKKRADLYNVPEMETDKDVKSTIYSAIDSDDEDMDFFPINRVPIDGPHEEYIQQNQKYDESDLYNENKSYQRTHSDLTSRKERRHTDKIYDKPSSFGKQLFSRMLDVLGFYDDKKELNTMNEYPQDENRHIYNSPSMYKENKKNNLFSRKSDNFKKDNRVPYFYKESKNSAQSFRVPIKRPKFYSLAHFYSDSRENLPLYINYEIETDKKTIRRIPVYSVNDNEIDDFDF